MNNKSHFKTAKTKTSNREVSLKDDYIKSDRVGETLDDIPSIWNLKKMIQMNLQNRKRLTDLENELMVVRRRDS